MVVYAFHHAVGVVQLQAHEAGPVVPGDKLGVCPACFHAVPRACTVVHSGVMDGVTLRRSVTLCDKRYGYSPRALHERFREHTVVGCMRPPGMDQCGVQKSVLGDGGY